MRRLVGIALLLVAAGAAGPVFSQVALVFPSGVAAGNVTPASAVLWTRLVRPMRVTVEVATGNDFGKVIFNAAVTPGVDSGGTVKIPAAGLSPGTRYSYRFRVGRGAYSAVGTFMTAPPADARADFRLAFSGDADGTHVNGAPVNAFDLLDAVAAERPDVFLFLGDTIYSDSSLGSRPAVTLEEYRVKHRENRSIPSLQNLLRATSVIAMWDDHEVENDFDRETVTPAKFAAGRQAFVESWPVAEGPTGRLYRAFRWGRDVELFILDLRSYRSRQASKTGACGNPPGGQADLAPTLPSQIRAAFAPLVRQMALPVPAECLAVLNDPNRTLLGQAQKTWLKQGLQRSEATWKFIVSQVPVQEFYALPYDRWEGYAGERSEMLNFIRLGNIKNVVWLSTDTHAVLINDVRIGTLGAQPETTGMKEVVAGPIATQTFGTAIAQVAGPMVPQAFAAFLTAPLPGGLGMPCAVLDRYTYATVEVRSAARAVTIIPKDAAGRPVCRAPLILTATP